MKRLVASISGLLAISSVAAAADQGLKQRLDTVVNQAVKDERVVGAVVLVAKDGKVVYKKAAGFADREAKRPVTLKTQFRLGSLSKPIVSAAASALADQGAFRLDDPISKWFPDFKPQQASGSTPDITIYQLLSHTAGLGYGYLEVADGPYHKNGVSDGFDRSVLSLDENLKRIAGAPLAYEPGTGWSYGIGYELVGGVLAKVGKGSLEGVVKQTVTKPLGLKTVTFSPANRKQIAAQYAFAIPRPRKLGDPDTVDIGKSPLAVSPERVFDRKAYPSAGAGLVGSGEDYLKFLETLRAGGEPILDRAAVYSLVTNSLGLINSPEVGKGWGFGYGVYVLKNQALANSLHSIGTWKLSSEYGSQFWVDPEESLSVVILTNTAGAGTLERFSDDITRAVYGPNRKTTLPTIGDIPIATVVAGKAYKFVPEATNAASFTIGNKPAWAEFKAENGALTGTPKDADVGEYKDIVITAVNNGGTAVLPAFSITVTAPQAAAPAPAEKK
jgi:CubicO group peptidase (beta-lactamase class C family)